MPVSIELSVCFRAVGVFFLCPFAKDASDIVLHDDNFSSVVKGMEQGPLLRHIACEIWDLQFRYVVT